jgi:hypothetical protein
MIRFIAGAVLIVGGLTGVIGAWGFVGVAPLATAFLRVCPAYSVIGLKTCKDC